MAEIIPFRGIHYDREKVRAEDVISPPYDLLTPEMRDALYGRSPYNAVRVDFGIELPGDNEAENKYTRASALMRKWLDDGILVRDPRPMFYAYRMDFAAGGMERTLTGFFGLVRLEEFGSGIYPHEATHSKPKSDRLSLMEATCANTSPIFSLYTSKSGTSGDISGLLLDASSRTPYLQAMDAGGTLHSLWPIDDPGAIESIRRAMGGASIIIADGHHRYETALDYRAMHCGSGDGACEFVLMFLADAADEGVTVLPTHRLVTVDTESMAEKLSGHFEVYDLPPGADIIEELKGKEHAFGLYAGGSSRLLLYKGGDLDDLHPALRGLDVVILHKMILGRLIEIGSWGYEMDPARARTMVDSGDWDAAFFLNPTPVRDVEKVAVSGLRMPPKSTYFYPKVQTGFLMNSLKSI